MRRRPWLWALLGLLILTICGVWLKSSSKRNSSTEIADNSTATVSSASVGSNSAAPMVLLSSSTNASTTNLNTRTQYRLRNTTQTVGQLARQDEAILLENALIDTKTSVPLGVPDQLRARGEHGSYIVQSRTALDDAFRGLLSQAGTSVPSGFFFASV